MDIKGYPVVFTGSAAITPARVAIPAAQPTTSSGFARALVVDNIDATNTLLVGFQAGGAMFRIPPGGSRTFFGTVIELYVASVAATAAYQCYACVS